MDWNMQWVLVPFNCPWAEIAGIAGAQAWHLPANDLWALKLESAWGGGWAIVRGADILPSLRVSLPGGDGTLDFSGAGHVSEGLPELNGGGGWRLFRNAAYGGWVLTTTSTVPLSYRDRADGDVGDDYYVASAIDVAGSARTVTFTGHGPNAGGTTVSATWIWPRLTRTRADGDGPTQPFGYYATAQDNWDGVASVVLGDRKYTDQDGEEHYMATSLDICGPASRTPGGVWRIGTPSDAGVCWECGDSLEADSDAETHTFAAVVGQDYEGEAPAGKTWTFNGFSGGALRRREIQVIDLARWV